MGDHDRESAGNLADGNTSHEPASCAAECHQKYANPKIFSIFFCLTGAIQGAYFTYLIGISSTLEKRYSYSSTVTGVILLADNIGTAIFSIFLGYCGKNLHRPKIISFGMFISALCCLVSCFPFFFFGSEVKTSFISSSKSIHLCSEQLQVESCDELIWESFVAIVLLFIAHFFKGVGSTAFYTIGFPYLDDNVKKKKSPFYLGATFAMRICGPTLGLWLSSFCLKYYENPLIEPGFGPNDSQWIGAWWMGFPVIGICLFSASFPIFFFPHSMTSRSKPNTYQATDKSLKDFLSSMKKLIRNPVLSFHTLSIIFQINGLFGYFSYMPKYIEHQYHNSASSANFYSGTVTLSSTIPVALFSGYIISRFKPRPKYLTGYMLFVQIFAGIIFIAAAFMYCEANENITSVEFLNHKSKECNSLCLCNNTVFTPVCDIYGINHFSACSAGCHEIENSNTKMTFRNCSCISMANNYSNEVQAVKGICSEDCQKFFPYIISIGFSKIFASSARVGNVLITLRSVDETDKVLALGAVEFFISLFATIPNPLFYGHVIDKSCLLWKSTCKEKGSCLFYDKTLFRYYLHGLSTTFIFLGACCDLVVYLLSSRLKNFYEEAEEADQNLESVQLNVIKNNDK